MTGRVRFVVEILLAGWLMAALYAAAASTFGPQSLVMLPYWLTALGDLVVGAWLALLIVDLRRTVIAVVASTVVATVAYFGLLVSAAVGAPDYLTNLVNYALPQTVPVLFLCLFLALVGGMVGTAINASARGIEL
ncbi:MAG TPA: hypothetical protein VFN57_00320 [Thermomicrobiaceae bacterium]|nr:hypothetical protein [Thermomicrobiaceae bacterium]